MSKRDVAVAQPGGVSTVPPAIPVRFWSSTDTNDAPPPTVTWTGTPPGRLSRNWLTPPASRKGSVPDGPGQAHVEHGRARRHRDPGHLAAAQVGLGALGAARQVQAPRDGRVEHHLAPRTRSSGHVPRGAGAGQREHDQPGAGQHRPDRGAVRRRDAQQGAAEPAHADVEERRPRGHLERGAGQVAPGHRHGVRRGGRGEGEGGAAGPRHRGHHGRDRQDEPPPGENAGHVHARSHPRVPGGTGDGHDRKRLDVAADHADQAVQHGPVADPQAVVLVLAGHPGLAGRGWPGRSASRARGPRTCRCSRPRRPPAPRSRPAAPGRTGAASHPVRPGCRRPPGAGAAPDRRRSSTGRSSRR